MIFCEKSSLNSTEEEKTTTTTNKRNYNLPITLGKRPAQIDQELEFEAINFVFVLYGISHAEFSYCLNIMTLLLNFSERQMKNNKSFIT